MRLNILVDIYLANNLGDDMFLEYLSTRYPAIDFTPFHPGKNYSKFFARSSNIKQFEYNLYDKIKGRLGFNKLKDYQKLSSDFDGLLYLGGGIFREESYWQEVYEFRKKITLAFTEKSKPVYFMGCNFGPYTTNEFKLSYEYLFSLCKKVHFRDIASFELFKSYDNIKYFPDILWDYPRVYAEREHMVLGISIINPMHKKRNEKEFNDYIISHQTVIRGYINRGFSVRLFSFCEIEGDLEMCRRIAIGFTNIEIYNYHQNINEFLALFTRSSIIIASRFHAVLLAIKYLIPVIPIIYGDKTLNLLCDLGCTTQKIGLSNVSEIVDSEFYIFEPRIIEKFKVLSKEHLNLD